MHTYWKSIFYQIQIVNYKNLFRYGNKIVQSIEFLPFVFTINSVNIRLCDPMGLVFSRESTEKREKVIDNETKMKT